MSKTLKSELFDYKQQHDDMLNQTLAEGFSRPDLSPCTFAISPRPGTDILRWARGVSAGTVGW